MQRFNLIAVLGIGIGLSHCGKETQGLLKTQDDIEYSYLRLSKDLLNHPDFPRSEFIADHFRSSQFAIGYLPSHLTASVLNSSQGAAVELDAKAWATQRMDPDTLAPLFDPAYNDRTADEPPYSYHNYNALRQALFFLRDQAPDLASVASAGQSEEGRDLLYVRLSSQKKPASVKPRVLLVGNMHGDETVGREFLLYTAQSLVKRYQNEARVRDLLDHMDIFILPSMNPDGFERGRRFNKKGIDLNRDFPDFTSDPDESATGRASETQALMRLHNEFNFVLSLNFHGGEVCFNLPWDTQPNTKHTERFSDDQLLQALARNYADLNPTMQSNSGGSFSRGVTYGYEWYEVDGGLQDWSIHYHQGTHATVELSFTKYPRPEALRTFFNENSQSLLQYLDSALFGIHLKISTADQRSVPTTITFSQGEFSRTMTFTESLVHKTTLRGTYKVIIRAEGYQEEVLQLESSRFKGDFSAVILKPQI